MTTEIFIQNKSGSQSPTFKNYYGAKLHLPAPSNVPFLHFAPSFSPALFSFPSFPLTPLLFGATSLPPFPLFFVSHPFPFAILLFSIPLPLPLSFTLPARTRPLNV